MRSLYSLFPITSILRLVGPDSVHCCCLSLYYLANEIARTYAGMMMAIPDESWEGFAGMTAGELGRVLKDLATHVRMETLQKHPRGPKKPVAKRPKNNKQPHISTARVLEKRKQTG